MIENTGPKIADVDLRAVEETLGASLPPEYRHFLLAFNGGAPTPDTIDVPHAPGTPTDVQVFFGIGRAVETSNLSWNLALIRRRCASQAFLPVACDSGGNLFCLEVERGVAMKVVYCDLEAVKCVFYPVAENFTEFLKKLREY